MWRRDLIFQNGTQSLCSTHCFDVFWTDEVPIWTLSLTSCEHSFRNKHAFPWYCPKEKHSGHNFPWTSHFFFLCWGKKFEHKSFQVQGHEKSLKQITQKALFISCKTLFQTSDWIFLMKIEINNIIIRTFSFTSGKGLDQWLANWAAAAAN